MKKYFFLVIGSTLVASVLVVLQRSQAQNAGSPPTDKPDGRMSSATGVKTEPTPKDAVFVTEIPTGYRDWKVISVAHEAGELNDIRVVLGNDIAIKAYREGKLSFPEGAIVGRIAWSYVSSEENNKILGRDQSFVAGSPTSAYLQFMIKDSKKYAATGGWGYSSFDKDSRPFDTASMQSCYPCHKAIKERDFIFTRYAP